MMSNTTRMLWGDGSPNGLIQPIRPIPCTCAQFIVTIDGKPYAGFLTRAYAEMAVGLWSGEIDGGGLRIPLQLGGRHGWVAARGRRLEIVERGHGERR
jgi:hypothetical protein